MLTIHRGHSVDYLIREVATGRENYYTGAVAEGEPPGRWYGAGADALGLTGLVDHQDMAALYEHFVDPRDPAFRDRDGWKDAVTLGHAGRTYKTVEELYAEALNAEPYAEAERRVQLRAEAFKRERKNVAFYDVTFSVQKSITVLHAAFEHREVQARRAGDEEAAAAWRAHKKAVEDAIWAGHHAAMDYLAEQAGYSRVGHHGGAGGRFTDAHGLIVASFFQHTSRTNDPHLHIHGAVLNRVQGADGVWRTLDGRSLYLHKPAAAAVGERTATEHVARSLRVLAVMRPDGKAREILDVPDEANKLLSTRRRAITPKTAELVAAFEHRYGRQPNALELDRLGRRAWAITRPRKSHDGETLEQRLDRIEAQLRAELNLTFDGIATRVLAKAGQDLQPQTFSPAAVIETALADVQATKASWTEADLAGAINDALPDYLGGLNADDVTELIHSLTRQAIEQHCVALTPDGPANATLPDALRLANGASAYQRPGERLYATHQHVRSERALRAAAIDRTAARVTLEMSSAFLDGLAEQGIELGVDQAAAIGGILTSGASVESLIGPAGTGKSFVVGVLNHAWTDPTLWDGQPRKVVGLAASQVATNVLAEEGLTARNITRWLHTQQRLAAGSTHPDDVAWRIGAGDLVVVDESAMADLPALAEIRRHVDEAGAKLLLTGDHKQLAAVGAAGGMELVAAAAPAHELSEARRFTQSWERAASLGLREGNVDALGEYRKHGRIIDAGAIEEAHQAAANAWLADTLAGKRSLLIVDTNEQADRICAQLRAQLVHLGHVDEDGVPLNLQGTLAGVGDLIQARRNAWELAGVLGNRRGPINREHYRVLATREDGGLVVASVLGRTADGEHLGDRMTLPGSYVSEHVALGYASTVHSAQGLTVDTAHAVATGRTAPAARYVALSRGREANTAYVVTRAVADADAPTGTANQVARRDPLAVLATADELTEPDRAASTDAEQNAAEARTLRTIGERFADVCELATASRTATMLDRLVDHGVLTPAQRAALAADDGTVSLARVLRQAELAGHDPNRVLRDAITSRDLADARSLASVLHQRITDTTDLHPAGDRYADWTPKVDDPAWQGHLNDLATIADRRRAQLGHEVAEHRPQWAIEALGRVPDDNVLHDSWVDRAAAIAAHRELAGHGDPDVALPGPPKHGQVEAYASWRAAWRSLGRDEASRAEAELSDGQLRVRVRAYEREQTWAPDYVAPDLSGTLQAAQRHHATAELRAAEAKHDTDVERRAELVRAAAEARALAELLDRRAKQLEKADETRALWYAHTAQTRAAEQRARIELAARGIDPDTAEDTTAAAQFLADQRAGLAEDDRHRELTGEHELADLAERRDAELRVIQPEPPTDVAETNVPDIRAAAAKEPKRPARDEDDWTRVPTADETADSVTRAQRALAELEQRQHIEQRRADEEARTRQLASWHQHDRAADQAKQHEDGRALDRI